MIELKIVAESNLKALETIETLFDEAKIKVFELKVDNNFKITNEKVYTIKIDHHDNKSA